MVPILIYFVLVTSLSEFRFKRTNKQRIQTTHTTKKQPLDSKSKKEGMERDLSSSSDWRGFLKSSEAEDETKWSGGMLAPPTKRPRMR